VRLARQSGTADVAANNGDAVLEGYTIKTDNTSRALLTLFDGSTVYVFENSDLKLEGMRTSRFTKSQTAIKLAGLAGRLRIGVAPSPTDDESFVVETPHATMSLEDGSYAVQVDDLGTALSVRTGQGVVSALKDAVTVKRGQRSTVARNQVPSTPSPAALDLVLNGDFRQKDVGWTAQADVETGRRDDVYGQTIFLSEPEGPGVKFIRRGSKDSHGENSIYQAIDRDVSDFVSLKLSVDFRLLYQSLSGGGYLGSEYPLMVHITYRDAKGMQVTWGHGFYYQNEQGYPTTLGEQVPADVWIPYEKDLFSLEGWPKPFRILSVEVIASGWDYESILKSISILAE
jgi:hypothetical protein